MGVLPIGFFAPLPLAIMIPFMAAQSFAMGQAFGTSFQYGKRKISSMSNEEFNKVTPTSLHDSIQSDVREMIPSMNQSFDRMEKFQIEIIQSMLDTFVLALEQFGKFLLGGIQAGGDAINQGFNTDVLTVQTRADIPDFIPQAEGATGGDIQTKFADDFYREAMRLPMKLLISIVSKFGQTKSNKIYTPEMRAGYKQAFFEREAPPKKIHTEKTIKKVIDTKSTGLVNQLATLFNRIKSGIAIVRRAKFGKYAVPNQTMKKLMNDILHIQYTQGPRGKIP